MSTPDWKALQYQFAAAHASTGISPRDWCEQQGLRYSSARRYIKKSAHTAQKKTAQKDAQSSVKTRSSQVLEGKRPSQNCANLDPGRSDFCANLSDKDRLFVSYFLESRNKYESYLKAGYTGSERNARILYRKPAVARAINQGIEQLSAQAILNAQDILRHWQEIAVADPGEISQLRRVCCRHCWGENFLYQWRDIDEFDKAAAKAITDNKPAPEYGGLGFSQNDDPNPYCPKCAGEGQPDIFLADTRDLTGPARRLVAGVRKTRFGIEVAMRDQDAALKNLAIFYNLAANEQEKELRVLEIQRRQLEVEKLRKELASESENDDPTSVAININIVDARVEDGDNSDS